MPELTKVLLVDDEPLVLDSTRELIRRDGRYDVHGAESGKKALELVAAEHYAVIVMDLMLADMNGIEVLKSVKELAPDTQVIMVSGKGTINQAVEAMKIGAFDLAQPPVPPERARHRSRSPRPWAARPAAPPGGGPSVPPPARPPR